MPTTVDQKEADLSDLRSNNYDPVRLMTVADLSKGDWVRYPMGRLLSPPEVVEIMHISRYDVHFRRLTYRVRNETIGQTSIERFLSVLNGRGAVLMKACDGRPSYTDSYITSW